MEQMGQSGEFVPLFFLNAFCSVNSCTHPHYVYIYLYIYIYVYMCIEREFISNLVSGGSRTE